MKPPLLLRIDQYISWIPIVPEHPFYGFVGGMLLPLLLLPIEWFAPGWLASDGKALGFTVVSIGVMLMVLSLYRFAVMVCESFFTKTRLDAGKFDHDPKLKRAAELFITRAIVSNHPENDAKRDPVEKVVRPLERMQKKKEGDRE